MQSAVSGILPNIVALLHFEVQQHLGQSLGDLKV